MEKSKLLELCARVHASEHMTVPQETLTPQLRGHARYFLRCVRYHLEYSVSQRANCWCGQVLGNCKDIFKDADCICKHNSAASSEGYKADTFQQYESTADLLQEDAHSGARVKPGFVLTRADGKVLPRLLHQVRGTPHGKYEGKGVKRYGAFVKWCGACLIQHTSRP